MSVALLKRLNLVRDDCDQPAPRLRAGQAGDGERPSSRAVALESDRVSVAGRAGRAAVWRCVAGERSGHGGRAALLYWSAAIYAAINIPVAAVLSTPLTWPMLRAARGPLADSLLLYLTWPNTRGPLDDRSRGVFRGCFGASRSHAVDGSGLRAAGRRSSAASRSARVDTLGFDRNVDWRS